MTKIEITPIDNGTHLRCDIAKHQERVAARAGVPIGEPIPELTDEQLRQYSQVLHDWSGLPKQDARRIFKDVRKKHQNGDEAERKRLAFVVDCAIKGLLGRRGSEPQAEPALTSAVDLQPVMAEITPASEVVVYKRTR